MPTEPHIYAYVSRVLVRPSLQNVPRSIVSGQSRKVKVCQNRHYLVPDRDCSTSAEMFYAPSKMPRLEVSPARFEFEKTCFYSNVLDYLGTVGKYRTVSKAFVPHEYITSVVLLMDVDFAVFNVFLGTRPSIKSLQFNSSTFMSFEFEAVVSILSRLTDLTINRSMYLLHLPEFSTTAMDTSLIGNVLSVSFPERTLQIRMNGCFRIFNKPSPTLSPEAVVEIILSCAKSFLNSAFTIAERFMDIPFVKFVQDVPGHLFDLEWDIFDISGCVQDDVLVTVDFMNSTCGLFYMKSSMTGYSSSPCWILNELVVIRTEPYIVVL